MKYGSGTSDTQDKWQAIQNTRRIASKRYIAKIGCVYLMSKQMINNHDQTKEIFIKDLRSHVRKILTTDQRVISIEHFAIDDERDTYTTFGKLVPSIAFKTDAKEATEGEFRLSYEFSDPLIFDLKLELHDKDKKVFWKEFPFAHTPDKCKVWYNCNTFVAYSDDSDELITGMGYAARDVLIDIFAESDLIDAKCVGPCPIHPDIEILFLPYNGKGGDSAETSPMLTQPVLYKNDIYVPIMIPENNTEAKLEDMLFSVFREMRKPISEFYSVQTAGIVAEYKAMALDADLAIIRTSIEFLHLLKFWKILEHRRIANSLTIGICNTTLSILDSQSEYANLARESEKLRKNIEESVIASCCADYLMESARESPRVDYSLITTILERLDSVVARYSINRTQLLAAILGGTIGAALTLFVAWLANVL